MKLDKPRPKPFEHLLKGKTYTAQELAMALKMNLRTLREYQTKGLLPPPKRQGRVAIYHEGHRIRLVTIERMKEEGHSLYTIAQFLKTLEEGQELSTALAWEQVTGGRDRIPLPPTPIHLSLKDAELALKKAVEKDAGLGRKARRARVFKHGRKGLLPGDPHLHQLAVSLVKSGLTPEETLTLMCKLLNTAENMAQEMIEVMVVNTRRQFDGIGKPPEGLLQITQDYGYLLEVAKSALPAVFMDMVRSEAVRRAGSSLLGIEPPKKKKY